MRNGFFFNCCTLALSVLAVAAAAAPASAEEIVLTPDHGPAGSKVQLSLCNFPDGGAKDAVFRIAFDGKVLVDSAPAGRCGKGAGLGGKSDAAALLLILDGAPGKHRLAVTISSSSMKAFTAEQLFDIDNPGVYMKRVKPRPPGPPALATPGPLAPTSAQLGNVGIPGVLNLTSPVAIHIDGVTPSPGRPDQGATVAFTVTNNTANDADVDVTGHIGSGTLGGRGRHLSVPAHGRISSTLSTFANATAGEVLVHARMLGGLNVNIGPDGLPRSVPGTLGEATDTSSLEVLAACTTMSVDPATFASIINVVEVLDALPSPYAEQYAASGQTFQPIFGSHNRLDIARFIPSPPAWQQNFINQTWISRSGNASTGLNGNSIEFLQSFQIHLDTVHMQWIALLDLTGDPTYDGHAFNVRTSAAHLVLDIPGGDQFAIGTAAAALAIPDPIAIAIAIPPAKEALRSELETMARDRVGSQIDAGLVALLDHRFPPLDDVGRSRTALSFAGPNIVMSYCFPSSH